jgi:hypothetical protein
LHRLRGGLVALGLAAALCLTPASAATFVVTHAENSGPGSLRQAILDANAALGRDTVEFNIPANGPVSIAPGTALPDITGPLAINGWSQPGSRPNTRPEGSDARVHIRLDGSRATNGITAGLRLRASNCEIRGLCIVNFHKGIDIESGQNSIIAGNWIGIDIDNLPSPNAFEGVNITGDFRQSSTRHRIGGTAPADRNVISCNGTGIQFFPDNAAENAVLGNYIGTDISGTLPRGNTFHGIMVQSGRNTLGGPNLAGRNVISANQSGIYILGSADNRIYANYIGTDVSGTLDLGNTGQGIVIQGSPRTTIGTEAEETGCVIANNGSHGIQILGSDDTTILGNILGSSPALDRVLGNQEHAILIDGSRTRVGGTNIGEANAILFSGKSSILISSGTNNLVRGNILRGQRGLPVDLDLEGRTANDLLDADAGPNQSLNHPVLSQATAFESGLRVLGTLGTAPMATGHVDFYGAAGAGWDGTAQAEVFLGSAEVQTGAQGVAAFDVTLPVPLPAGAWVCAVAMDRFGNTSEYSDPIRVEGLQPQVRLTWIRTGGALLLRWPSAAIGAFLETSASLGPDAPWLPVQEPVRVAGSQKLCEVAIGGEARPMFFRLRSAD